MSHERSAALAALDRVVADPMRFKARLRIGEDAYPLRRLTKEGWRWWDTAGAAGTAVAVAKSSAVAGTFFAPTGFVAWLGLASAVTPVGWVIAAAALAGGGYYGVSRWWATRPDSAVDVVPRFISTPIDRLGVALFDLIAGLSFAVARADGAVDEGERALIVGHLRDDWGFDPAFIAAAMPLLEADADDAAVEAAARGFGSFLRGNPDCNTAAMQVEMLAFLRELMGADGRIDPAETAAVKRIEAAFAPATGWSTGIAASARGARTLADGAADGVLDLLSRFRRRPR